MEVFTKVVETTIATVYGPTDVKAAKNAELLETTVIRSDYLDKLAIAVDEGKHKATLAQIGSSADARGSDADHPYVTREDGILRAWRYIAVL